MKAKLLGIILASTCLSLQAQVSPEMLWKLGRVSAQGISDDGSSLVYKVTSPQMEMNDFSSTLYELNFESGEVTTLISKAGIIKDSKISPDGKWKLESRDVKLLSVTGTDLYPKLPKSDAYVFDQLHYRHWDHWEDGAYGHVFIVNMETSEAIDLMKDERYDCPTKPFGGPEDYIWNTDGTKVLYVTKKVFGTEYVNSTNTDIYSYDIASGETENLTAENKGYDMSPTFSQNGTLAYLSMKRDGYEADKNDIKVRLNGENINLTHNWDGTVREIMWGPKGEVIYFTAPTMGTIQLFKVNVPKKNKSARVEQITTGQWDVGGLVGFHEKSIISGRTDMNHARELYSIDLKSGDMNQLTHVNDEAYAGVELCKVESRMVATTDGKEMLTWVIYPPNFDPAKKYPTLLYTQGGPQSALSQFYSFRWNFQVMASQGYIVVAPNRRGMPGYGVEWNEEISGDWGGQSMDDYLSAIDALAKEPFVDNDKLGCVGASYGGYSAFFLAGIHEERFKAFIAHDGVFNLRSMYGNTEELFFVNWDLGGPYWDETNAGAQMTYSEFNPINYVANWDTPILIIQGGKDYRVTEGQAFEAFTAAQQLGIKSRLLYFPEENHWVLSPQNGLVWQSEFFRWLDENVKN